MGFHLCQNVITSSLFMSVEPVTKTFVYIYSTLNCTSIVLLHSLSFDCVINCFVSKLPIGLPKTKQQPNIRPFTLIFYHNIFSVTNHEINRIT